MKKKEAMHHCLGALALGTVFVLLVTGLVVGTTEYMKNVHAHPEAYED